MPAQGPHALYREKLQRRLIALEPGRLLEVGCGRGGFLRSAAAAGIEALGIDLDEASLRELRDEGFDVQKGSAEQLEFAEDSFDATVFCFSAHHMADWRRAMEEALRVSRRAVIILDPWYETGIPSQAVAERFDRWCKKIDRAGGMVHNDCLDVTQLLAPISSRLPDFDIGLEYLLELRSLDPDRLDAMAQEHLAKTRGEPEWLEELDAIKAEARQFGISDDGAILLSVRKRNAPAPGDGW